MQLDSIIPASKLAEYDIATVDGEILGQVHQFMVDADDGRVAFAVVSLDGIPDTSDKWFALPWEVLDWSPEAKRFMLSAPREVLEEAPGLDESEWTEEIDVSWLKACYGHFGCTPSWGKPDAKEERIKTLAYYIWENEGKPDGKDQEHYFRAMHIIEQEEAEQACASTPPEPPHRRARKHGRKK